MHAPRDGVPVRDHVGEPRRGVGAGGPRRARSTLTHRGAAHRLSRDERARPSQRCAATAPGRRRSPLFALLHDCAELSAPPTAHSTSRRHRSAAAGGFSRRDGRVPSAEAIEPPGRSSGMRPSTSQPDSATVRVRAPGRRVEPRRRGQGVRARSRRGATSRTPACARAALGGHSSLLAIGGRDPAGRRPRVAAPRHAACPRLAARRRARHQRRRRAVRRSSTDAAMAMCSIRAPAGRRRPS